MSESIERYGIYAVILGFVLTVVGYVWMLIRAHRKQLRRRLLMLGFPPAAPVYALFHFRKMLGPLMVFGLGLLLAGSPYLINRVSPHFIELGARDKQVNGERHLTLTGWNQSGYADILRARADATVVQMANPDVDDKALEPLSAFQNLHELDLSHTGITDAGLATLARLTNLGTLRLAGTAITDSGFKAHLAQMPSLRMLDVRETGISPETLAAWRDAQPGRRALPRPPAQKQTGDAQP